MMIFLNNVNNSLDLLEHLYNLTHDLVRGIGAIISFLTTSHNFGFTFLGFELGMKFKPIDLISSGMITTLLLLWIIKSLIPAA